MTTVRELIQALLMNCDLDDKISVEFREPLDGCNDAYSYKSEKLRRVFHMGYGESIIECHDD